MVMWRGIRQGGEGREVTGEAIGKNGRGAADFGPFGISDRDGKARFQISPTSWNPSAGKTTNTSSGPITRIVFHFPLR